MSSIFLHLEVLFIAIRLKSVEHKQHCNDAFSGNSNLILAAVLYLVLGFQCPQIDCSMYGLRKYVCIMLEYYMLVVVDFCTCISCQSENISMLSYSSLCFLLLLFLWNLDFEGTRIVQDGEHLNAHIISRILPSAFRNVGWCFFKGLFLSLLPASVSSVFICSMFCISSWFDQRVYF